MKAGSLLTREIKNQTSLLGIEFYLKGSTDDDLGPLRESQEIAISRRSVPRSVFAALFSLPSSIFLARTDLESEISNLRSEISNRSRIHWWLSAQLARRRKSRTCSSAESERDRAKVEVARSNRARSTKRKDEVERF